MQEAPVVSLLHLVTSTIVSRAASLKASRRASSMPQKSTLLDRLPVVVTVCVTIEGCRLGNDEGGA